jgi:hypothetical protein
MEGWRGWEREREREMEVEETAGCIVVGLMRCRDGARECDSLQSMLTSPSPVFPPCLFFAHLYSSCGRACLMVSQRVATQWSFHSSASNDTAVVLLLRACAHSPTPAVNAAVLPRVYPPPPALSSTRCRGLFALIPITRIEFTGNCRNYGKWQGDVKDDVVPLIIKEFGIDIKDIFFLDGSGLKVLYAPLPLLFLWGGGGRLLSFVFRCGNPVTGLTRLISSFRPHALVA